MLKTIILYSTTDGHTKKISERIILGLKNRKKTAIVELKNDLEISLLEYDEIIIGASIRYGKHQKCLYDFIAKNKDLIEKKKNAFFTVNVVARKIEKNEPTTNPYMKKFLEITSWKPKKLAVFAGKLNYPAYTFFDKQLIRLIMYITKGPTDTSKIFEFTDWNSVDKFATELS